MTDVPTKVFQPGPRHMTLKSDIDKLLKKHSTRLSAQEIMAICAQITGMTLAYQDQRVMTPEMGLQIIKENIEEGNRQAIAGLMKSKGSG